MANEIKTVDDKVLQRILFASSDIIGQAISTDNDELINQKILRLNALSSNIIEEYESMSPPEPVTTGVERESTILNPENQQKTIRRQQQLFSDSFVTSDEAAFQLFSDNRDPTPIDNSYFLTHHILLHIEDEPMYFNIDEVNKNKEIFISKVIIKNQAKDIFTLKANYKINLKIHFTNFDDLLRDSIIVKSVRDPNKTAKIAPLFLLYKFFKNAQLPLAVRHLPDISGIFLNQSLILLANSPRNKKSIEDLGTNLISKNYHLTYYKHSIDMFRSDEPIFKKFENELNIEYVAYEADGVSKSMSQSVAKSIAKVNGNIYTLLSGEWKKKLGTPESSSTDEYENIFKRYSLLAKINERYQSLLNCGQGTEVNNNIEEIKKRIGAINNDLINLKVQANRELINQIMRICKTYRLILPSDVVGIYQRDEFNQELDKSWSLSGLIEDAAFGIGGSTVLGGLGIFGLGGGAGLVAGGASAASFLIGAGAGFASAVSAPALITGIAIYFGYKALVAHLNSQKIYSSEIDFVVVKSIVDKAIGDGRLQILPSGHYSSLLKYDPENKQEIKPLTPEELSKSQKKRKEMIEKVAVLEIPQLTEGETVNIDFTTFGELMKVVKLVDPSDQLHIISGGYFIDIDKNTENSSFNNFANLPITINSFANFLYKFIEETERQLMYDSEVFLKDCYENLLRNIVNDANNTLRSLVDSIPNNLRIISTIHVMDGKEGWFKDTNLLDNSAFDNLKSNFIRSKNFILNDARTGLGSKNFAKIYVIGTFEQVKYYNFYEEYDKWVDELNNRQPKQKTGAKFQYNSWDFQEYINKKHLIPCLLMRAVSNSESLLKKKYVNFSRIDNTNLNTGQFLQGFGHLRYQYQFKADFKLHTSFFLDIGSHMFIAPPTSKLESSVTGTNTFGFGGLYIIRGAELEYNFQRIQDGKLTLPNYESKYSLDGYMLSHGDSLRKVSAANQQAAQKNNICDDPFDLSKSATDQVSTEITALYEELNKYSDIKKYTQPLSQGIE